MLKYRIGNEIGISSSIFFFPTKDKKSRFYFSHQDKRRNFFQNIYCILCALFSMTIVFYKDVILYVSFLFFMATILNFILPKKTILGKIGDEKIIGIAPPVYIIEWFLMYLTGGIILYNSLNKIFFNEIPLGTIVLLILLFISLFPIFEIFLYIKNKNT